MTLPTNKGLSLPYSCKSPLAAMAGAASSGEERWDRGQAGGVEGREKIKGLWMLGPDPSSGPRASAQPAPPFGSFFSPNTQTTSNSPEDTNPTATTAAVTHPRGSSGPGLCNQPRSGCALYLAVATFEDHSKGSVSYQVLLAVLKVPHHLHHPSAGHEAPGKDGGKTKGFFLQLQPPHGSRRRGGSLPRSWLPPAPGAAPLIPPQTPGPAGLLQGVTEARGSVGHGEGKGGESQGLGVRGQRGIGAGTRGLLSGEGGSVPCRCPAPWPRHSGGCRRRGPAQGPNPRASSDARGGAAHGSEGGCRCRRRSPCEREGSSEGADGGSLRPPAPPGAPAVPPLPPQRSALSQRRLRVPSPPHRPAALIGRSAQVWMLGCFRRRPKSASPRVTRRCLRRPRLRTGTERGHCPEPSWDPAEPSPAPQGSGDPVESSPQGAW